MAITCDDMKYLIPAKMAGQVVAAVEAAAERGTWEDAKNHLELLLKGVVPPHHADGVAIGMHATDLLSVLFNENERGLGPQRRLTRHY